ncbi:MAG: hypothetical protein B6U68_00875 [Candidatus Aenigmarchaeota archaeon ex4484_14]|nr:MAG: hypothetical protein B6U68_00875 [Candidatus Aenigmarchaeota archaeon ex4484_14]
MQLNKKKIAAGLLIGGTIIGGIAYAVNNHIQGLHESYDNLEKDYVLVVAQNEELMRDVNACKQHLQKINTTVNEQAKRIHELETANNEIRREHEQLIKDYQDLEWESKRTESYWEDLYKKLTTDNDGIPADVEEMVSKQYYVIDSQGHRRPLGDVYKIGEMFFNTEQDFKDIAWREGGIYDVDGIGIFTKVNFLEDPIGHSLYAWAVKRAEDYVKSKGLEYRITPEGISFTRPYIELANELGIETPEEFSALRIIKPDENINPPVEIRVLGLANSDASGEGLAKYLLKEFFAETTYTKDNVEILSYPSEWIVKEKGDEKCTPIARIVFGEDYAVNFTLIRSREDEKPLAKWIIKDDEKLKIDPCNCHQDYRLIFEIPLAPVPTCYCLVADPNLSRYTFWPWELKTDADEDGLYNSQEVNGWYYGNDTFLNYTSFVSKDTDGDGWPDKEDERPTDWALPQPKNYPPPTGEVVGLTPLGVHVQHPIIVGGPGIINEELTMNSLEKSTELDKFTQKAIEELVATAI